MAKACFQCEDIGAMTTKVEVRDRQGTVDDGSGGYDPADVLKATIFAAVEPKQRTKVFEDGQTKGIVVWELTTWYTDTLAALDLMEMSLKIDGRWFEVISVVDREAKHQFFDLQAMETRARG